ncbi:MAG: gliding motility-associated ABC transporter ATP-binding subunit GldA [Cytophagales bacterium]|nr:MAG: gliding motility-associated ABC transporter ATP-binding subunit GldA [Cytophagales bacterium]
MSIIISNLTKQYAKQKAVNDISFEVNTGQIVGFLGPNGAGKSTTMKIITTYIPPTSGSVQVCGYDVIKQPMQVRKSIGYLPEHNPLYLDMYVKEYLYFIASLHQLKAKDKKQRVSEMIQLCGLTKEQHKKIGSLSKGYRQRVGLAQALIHNPPVLILDEPTTGLDPNQIVEIRNLIREIGKEKTVLFSTHIMQEVQAICDRAIIIHQGNIVANNAVQELQTMPTKQNRIWIAFEKPIEIALLQNALPEVQINTTDSPLRYEVLCPADREVRAEIAKIALQHQWIVVEMKQEEISLETVFQLLTSSNV